DDKSDKAAARKFYERLVTVDKVDVLIGPYSSPITVGASAVAEKHKVPFVCVEANATVIYKRGFKWIVGVLASGELWSDHYFDLLKSEGKAKSIGFVTEDHLHALDVYRGAIRKAKAVGLKVLVDKQRVPSKTTDFTPIITEIKAKDPDIVYISSFIPFGIAFMKQAKELDLNPREFHVIHHGGGFMKALGKDANYVTGEDYPAGAGVKFGDLKFFEELLKRTNTSTQAYPWTAIRVPAMNIIVDALKRAGSLDKAKIMKALKETELETVGGLIRFAANGSGTMNALPTQIQGEKRVLIAPRKPGYPVKAHLYPTPPWRERK
ncbi:MAG: amino acid ABC transporter substrate-binding protein, partial [Nitrospinota bacterium]